MTTVSALQRFRWPSARSWFHRAGLLPRRAMEAAYAKHKFETPGFHFQLGNDNRSQHFDKKKNRYHDTWKQRNCGKSKKRKLYWHFSFSVTSWLFCWVSNTFWVSQLPHFRPWPEPICTLPTSPGSHHVAWGNQLSGTDFSTHRELLVRNPHHDCLGGITGITDHFFVFWGLGTLFFQTSLDVVRCQLRPDGETMVAVFP